MNKLYSPRAMITPPPLDENSPAGPIRKRHALLVNPFYPKDPRASFGKHVLTPALTFGGIAAATPPEWNVQFWDENLLQGPPPAPPLPQAVGITVHLTFAKRAYQLARWFRSRGAKVIMGGPHVLSCPEEVAPHADSLCIGEGVSVWPRFLRDIEAGSLQKIYEGSYHRPFDQDPLPRRDILPRGSFLTPLSVIATRGCKNRCGFCYLSTRGISMPRQTRPVRQVAREIESSGEPYAVFIDNNLGADPEYLRSLCHALRPLDIIWSAAVTLDVTDDTSLVRSMALSGCTGVFIGFESLSDKNLSDSGKRCPKVEDYSRRVDIFHRNGIQVNGSFVFGFDEDRGDVFQNTVRWIEENRLACATFHILTPYPGTPLFRRMKNQGRLLHTEWTLYDTSHAVFKPAHMTPSELEQGYAWCYKRLFSLSSIWKRRPSAWSEAASYLLLTMLYKRSNLLWPLLIKHRLTSLAWRPLIKLGRRKHVKFRTRLEQLDCPANPERPSSACPANRNTPADAAKSEAEALTPVEI